jgi:hypothetical protein
VISFSQKVFYLFKIRLLFSRMRLLVYGRMRLFVSDFQNWQDVGPTGHGPEGCVENGPAAVRRLPDRLRINLDMRPPNASPARTALPAAHFERNDVITICETVHQEALNHRYVANGCFSHFMLSINNTRPKTLYGRRPTSPPGGA